MPNLAQVTPEDWAKHKGELCKQFPGAKFGWAPDAKPALLNTLRIALESGSEEVIQDVLTANPYLIQYAVKRSGHHGIWIFRSR